MSRKLAGKSWTFGKRWGCTALIAAILLALITAERSPAHRHRYHSRGDAGWPQVVVVPYGEWRVTTQSWPHVPVTALPLKPGWFYAVSPAEAAAAIDSLPAAWRETIAGVRLSPSPDGEVMAETDGETIQLHYVVDREGLAPVASDEDIDEESEFGGIPVVQGSQLFIRWPRRGLLRTYVLKHLLIHEVGHHMAPPGLDDDADERWAEAFAFRYYRPTRHLTHFDTPMAAPLY